MMYSKPHLLGLLTGASKRFTEPVLQWQGLFLSYWISFLARPQLKTIFETSSAQIVCHTRQRNFDLGPSSGSVGLNALLCWKLGVRWLTLSLLMDRKAETNWTAEVCANNAGPHSGNTRSFLCDFLTLVYQLCQALADPTPCAGCSIRWSRVLRLFPSQHVVLWVHAAEVGTTSLYTNGSSKTDSSWHNWAVLLPDKSYITNWLFFNGQNKGAYCLRHSLHMPQTSFVFQYLWALLLKSTPVGGVKIWYEGMLILMERNINELYKQTSDDTVAHSPKNLISGIHQHPCTTYSFLWRISYYNHNRFIGISLVNEFSFNSRQQQKYPQLAHVGKHWRESSDKSISVLY